MVHAIRVNKKAAINILVHRMNKYPITKENKDKEQWIISTILMNNHYNLQAMYQRRGKKKQYGEVACHGNDTPITKLFKNTNINIAYRTI
jgi:hypothetical protein